jgi:hypothetical protein
MAIRLPLVRWEPVLPPRVHEPERRRGSEATVGMSPPRRHEHLRIDKLGWD